MNSYLVFLLVISLLLMKNCEALGGRKILGKEYITFDVNSYLSTSCKASVQGRSRPASLKVTHRYTHCSTSGLNDSYIEPSLAEILARDQIHVASLQNKHHGLKTKSNIDDDLGVSKATISAQPDGGSYVVSVGLGTPTKFLTLVFDTGSSLTWTQCQPCAGQCYNTQKDPIFDPSASTSYSNDSCNSAQCSQLSGRYARGCTAESTCIYRVTYGDKSNSTGYLANERLTLTPNDVFDNFPIGCGEDNEGQFGDIAGILGLGRDYFSVVSQTAGKYGKQFSYCLPTQSGSNGHLTFGNDNAAPGNIVYTPLGNDPDGDHYSVNIVAIGVGGTQLAISPSVFQAAGLAGWKTRFLSFGGRITLIKAVLGSLPLYFFSLFHAPEAVIRILERLRANFFWGGGNGERKISWISWNTIMKDKRCGGLGVLSLKTQNEALLGKWWWRYKSGGQSLWKSVIGGIYGWDGGFEGEGVVYGKGKTWGQILKNFNRINMNGVNLSGSLRWVLGDGKKILFWEDVWMGNEVLKNRFARLYRLAMNKSCKVGENWREGEWVWDWKRELRGREVGEFNDLCNLISNYVINHSAGDTPWWKLNNKGKFTVKDLKKLIQKSEDSACASSFFFQWNNLIPSKINIFGWRAAHRRMPTKDNLSKRGITLSSLGCPMCNADVETEQHLFVVCPLAFNIWKLVFSWCEITDPVPLNFKELASWFKIGAHKKFKKKLWDAIFKITTWSIWCKRNDSIFNSKSCTVIGTFKEIQLRSFEWITGRMKHHSIVWENWVLNPLKEA